MMQRDYCCHSVVFKRNILIAGAQKNLMLFSAFLDSFTIIPYEFNIARKILINTERLYIIECEMGFIYESEVEDVYALKKIAKSGLRHYPLQVSCTYNKGGIYIGCIQNPRYNYWKFSLDIKKVDEIL
ncbi:unnamed protein product [Blepharisma stoltei]|uniref:Uncharacterized protein n=1 Tax=Blepharisma stoltei TaxID=1481888 RepID=A0AAU9IL40_9CILI|nr:unnamed protein product [Blepharisma stoltei]